MPKSPGSVVFSSTIVIPRSLARTSALTRLTWSSRAASIQPAAKLAVISRVFLLRDLAAIAERRALDRPPVHLGVEHAEAAAEVEVEPQVSSSSARSSVGMLTANRICPRSKKSIRSRAASTATEICASSVEAPRWGVTRTCGWLTSGWSGRRAARGRRRRSRRRRPCPRRAPRPARPRRSGRPGRS